MKLRRRASDGTEDCLAYLQPVVFEVAHLVAALDGEVGHVDVDAKRGPLRGGGPGFEELDGLLGAVPPLDQFEPGGGDKRLCFLWRGQEADRGGVGPGDREDDGLDRARMHVM